MILKTSLIELNLDVNTCIKYTFFFFFFLFQKHLPGHKKVETVSVKNEMDLLKAYLMSSVFYCHFSLELRGREKNTVSASTAYTDSFQKPTVVKIPCSLLSSKKPFLKVTVTYKRSIWNALHRQHQSCDLCMFLSNQPMLFRRLRLSNQLSGKTWIKPYMIL